MSERTLIIIKPDAMQRSLAGKIISRFEEKGFKIVASKVMVASNDLAEKHYAVHKGKDFFEGLCKNFSSSAIMVMVWQGNNIIELSRKIMGATFAQDAQPGTIRGDFSCTKSFNLVHGSDSPESAKYEISLYFDEDEIADYDLSNARWLSD